jgi:hypothetical protein
MLSIEFIRMYLYQNNYEQTWTEVQSRLKVDLKMDYYFFVQMYFNTKCSMNKIYTKVSW